MVDICGVTAIEIHAISLARFVCPAAATALAISFSMDEYLIQYTRHFSGAGGQCVPCSRGLCETLESPKQPFRTSPRAREAWKFCLSFKVCAQPLNFHSLNCTFRY